MMASAEKKQINFLEKEKSQDVFYHGVFNLKDTPKEEENKVEEPKENKTEKSDLGSKFDSDRQRWKTVILTMAKKMLEMGKMTELQVELYSNRQIVLEESHYLQSLLAKVIKAYKKSQGSKYNDYLTGDRKMKMGETNLLVEAATAELKEQIDLIQSQIEYLNDTKKNIDNMIFGLGHRIELEKYRSTT